MSDGREEFRQRLLRIFVDEAKTQVASIPILIDELERDPSRMNLVDVLLLKVHSLKGAADAIDQEQAALLCRLLEQMAHKARAGELPVDIVLCSLFRQGMALLEDGLTTIAHGGTFTISLHFLEGVRKLMGRHGPQP